MDVHPEGKVLPSCGAPTEKAQISIETQLVSRPLGAFSRTSLISCSPISEMHMGGDAASAVMRDPP